MPKKYDIDDVENKTDKLLVKTKDKDKEMKDFLDKLDKIKELDEQNPLEQAIKYKAVKQNPPLPGYMEVRAYDVKDEKNKDIIISESDVYNDKGEYTGKVKRFKHDPFFTVDLNKLFMADITACPSNVGPMLIDMGQKLVELKKTGFGIHTRRSEFNWWWIILAILLIPGIITVILMFSKGG